MSLQRRNQQLINLLKQDFLTHDAHEDIHSEDLVPHDIISSHTVTGSALDVIGLSGTDTLAVLTPSSSPGAAASLLKTTSAGLLTLENLTVSGLVSSNSATITTTLSANDVRVTGGSVQTDNFATGTTGWQIPYNGNAEFRNIQGDYARIDGSVDILSGGDLTVGNNILFVDVSGSRVGINTSPDPQFQLDINGNIRWSGWGVGKMAIQLDDAVLLCHFDGKRPYSTNFQYSSTSHKGQAPTDHVGGVIGRPGKFGTKGLQTAEATTNHVTNPLFENNVTDGWTHSHGGGSSISRDTSRSFIGNASLKLTADTNSNPATMEFQGIIVPNGSTIWFQARGYRETAINAAIWLYDATNSNTVATQNMSLTDEWELLLVSWTNNTGADAIVRGWLRNQEGDGASPVWFDAVQYEEKVTPTPFAAGYLDIPDKDDGTLGNHQWSGTAHNSESSRAIAYLNYWAPDVLDPDEGTFMVWVKPFGEIVSAQHYRIIHGQDTSGDTSDQLYLGIDTNGVAVAGVGGVNAAGTTAIPANSWTHLAMTWDHGTCKLFVNGQLEQSFLASISSISDLVAIGKHRFSVEQSLNGVVDDLVWMNRAAEPDEITSVYESDAPVFAETSTFSWQDPTVTIWVDEEGLYARDQSGNPIMALATVNSKSWGGKTLDEGDWLLGNDTDGFLYWDISTPELTIKATVSELNIASGAVILDSNGITVEAPASLVRSSYVQWDTSAGSFRGRIGTNSAGTMDIEATTVSLNYYDGTTGPLQAFRVAYDTEAYAQVLNGLLVGQGGSPGPAHLLDVTENLAGYIGRFFNDGNNDNRSGLIIQCGADSNPAQIVMTFRDGDGTSHGTIRGDGAGGTDYNQTSDERRKQDITNLTGALTSVLALQPIEYRGLGQTDADRKVPGLSAQATEPHIPAAVHYDAEDDTYSLAYNKMIPHLVGAIQELEARLAALEAT